MKKSVRMLLVTCAGLLGLAFAGPALAAYEPSLTVEQSNYKVGGSPTVDFFIFSDPDNDPTAKLTIFSPSGYSSNISQAPGTTIGNAVAFVKAGALGGSILPLAGPVVVGDPSSASIKAAAQQCTGSAATQAVWVLDTQLQGQKVTVPDFVNKVGPYLVQQICLPAPKDAAFQAQLVSADFNVRGVFTSASSRGAYQWALDGTPYLPGTGTVNPTGTSEWRTYVGLPSSLTLKLGKNKAGKRTLTGKLSIAGLNPAGVRLYVYGSKKARPAPNATSAGTGKVVGRTKPLKSTGKYTFRIKVRRTTFFQTRFENYGLLGSCQGPSPSGLPIPCKGTDLAPLTSNQLRVKPIRRR